MNFDAESAGVPVEMSFWRDGSPSSTATIRRIVADDSMAPKPITHESTYCELVTPVGAVRALLERIPKTTLPTERDSIYTIQVKIRDPRRSHGLLFSGTAVDRLGFAEQLAIARTVRWLLPQ